MQWTSLAGNLVLIFFLLNFTVEMKHLEDQSFDLKVSKVFNGILKALGALALVFSLSIGAMVLAEANRLSSWLNRGPERAMQLAEPFDANFYVDDQSDTLNYRLLKPLDYHPEKEYPLVVCLHGGGGVGNDNFTQIEGSWTAQMLSKIENRSKYPAFIFVPQCPPGSVWGGIPNQPTIDQLVFEAIGQLEREYNINSQRLYLLVESLGGYGTWHFICTRPELFAAAVPICGGGNPECAQDIAHVPVWAFHGAKDRSVPVRLSRNMIEAVKRQGGSPRYTEFPNSGHIISQQVWETPDLLEWLFTQELE